MGVADSFQGLPPPRYSQDAGFHLNRIDYLAVSKETVQANFATIQALTYLYPKLSIGGYVIIDDYGALPPCERAVKDYRTPANDRLDWSPIFSWREV